MKVLILQSPDGLIEVVTDAPAEVICVDEHAPNDRLYRLTAAHEVSADRVAKILRTDPIGSSSDDRHEAIANRITAHIDGRPHLVAIDKTD